MFCFVFCWCTTFLLDTEVISYLSQVRHRLGISASYNPTSKNLNCRFNPEMRETLGFSISEREVTQARQRGVTPVSLCLLLVLAPEIPFCFLIHSFSLFITWLCWILGLFQGLLFLCNRPLLGTPFALGSSSGSGGSCPVISIHGKKCVCVCHPSSVLCEKVKRQTEDGMFSNHQSVSQFQACPLVWEFILWGQRL